jgi:hypothetical protein
MFGRHTIPLLVVACVVLLSCVMLFRWKSHHRITGAMITQDLEQLGAIFKRIDNDCSILGFAQEKNPIDFLNVQSFSGSQVGTMNIMFPNKWAGPYLENNLALQKIDYQVVHTAKGYFIVPGDGVVLPNGKKMGQDIIVDKDVDMQALVQDPQALSDDQNNIFSLKIEIVDKAAADDLFLDEYSDV